MKKYLIIFFSLTIHLSFGQSTEKIKYGQNNSVGHFLTLEGVKLYYEEYGTGAPMVLLHGNGGNIEYMAPQIEYFSKKYRVIVMDCRGRGKSELGKDSLTYIQMTKDLNALLDYLQIDSTYIIGRSDGGIIGLMMGIYFPKKTKKIAAFG
ncbi:MAG: alpha/beta hydrolase, partial [Bacteroidota bacterium]